MGGGLGVAVGDDGGLGLVLVPEGWVFDELADEVGDVGAGGGAALDDGGGGGGGEGVGGGGGVDEGVGADDAILNVGVVGADLVAEVGGGGLVVAVWGEGVAECEQEGAVEGCAGLAEGGVGDADGVHEDELGGGGWMMGLDGVGDDGVAEAAGGVGAELAGLGEEAFEGEGVA